MHRTIFALVTLFTMVVSASADDKVELVFINHLQKSLVEQHVYVERVPKSGEIFRVTPVDQHRYTNSPVFAAAKSVANAPMNHGAIGPYKRGKPLGITLGDWLAASGAGSYTCINGAGKVQAKFSKLVPNAVYTMWYALVPRPPLDPFVALDMPLGKRDGSQSVFTTDAAGSLNIESTFKPCLQMGGLQVDALLAIAWHSDRKTYGATPGPFSTVTHVQLLAEFPVKE
jgi:hypothetical protein